MNWVFRYQEPGVLEPCQNCSSLALVAILKKTGQQTELLACVFIRPSVAGIRLTKHLCEMGEKKFTVPGLCWEGLGSALSASVCAGWENTPPFLHFFLTGVLMLIFFCIINNGIIRSIPEWLIYFLLTSLLVSWCLCRHIN